MTANTTFENFLSAFRSAKRRKREWEQRMDKKLAALEEEMNIRRTLSILVINSRCEEVLSLFQEQVKLFEENK